MIKYVPNILSIIRIIMAPVFVYLYNLDYPENTLWALLVFLLAGLTDIVDGIIARRFNCQSNLGKILDPFADKLMSFVAFLCLCIRRVVPIFLPIVYVIKELLMLVGAMIIMKNKKVVVVSSWYGKSATVIIFAAVAVFILFGKYFTTTVRTIISVAVLAYILFALVMYYLTCYRGAVTQKKENKKD